MITLDNWEEYAILRADGELDGASMAALESFLEKHPELGEEAQLYESVRLVPDEAIVFAGKKSLLKPEPRVIPLGRRWMWAAAAGVALLIGAMALLRGGEEGIGTSGAVVAGMVKIASPVAPATNPKVVAPVAEQSQALPEEAESALAKESVPAPPAVIPGNVPEEASVNAIPPANELFAELRPRSAMPLPVAAELPQTVEARAVPAAAAPDAPPRLSSHLLDHVAFSGDKLRVVGDLRDAASERITALRTTREKLRDTDLTVQIGKHNLFTLHF